MRLACLSTLVLTGCLEPALEGWVTDGSASSYQPGDFGRWLSIDVAPDGERLVMAAYEKVDVAPPAPPDGGLVFGVRQLDGTWRYEQVDGYRGPSGFDTGNVGTYASLKVAPDGTIWIAYRDETRKVLRWAHRRAGGPATSGEASWVTGDIDASGDVGTWASLAIGANGAPVVAYHDEGNGTLKVARVANPDAPGDQITWNVEVVVQGNPYPGSETEPPRPADVGEFARLLVAGGSEFIAYYDRAQRRLGFAERTGNSGWTHHHVSPVEPDEDGTVPDMGQWPSLLNDGGTLYVAYHDVTHQRLMVSTRTPGGWTHEVADSAPFTGADSEIVKRGGRIGVLYFDGQNNDLKYAEKAGNVWNPVTLAGDGEAIGFHNELVRVGDTWWAGTYSFATRKPEFYELKVGAAE